ncbi:Cysteine/Histidine-rich C1 domain family protein, putative [Theobroma cacao]|uniref:Cysteine/Histidine-rich C1 domain family protein, putative n=1 Tax=Theobroma cacao TaxID=3641 RepID=A0A061FMJ6_THECC|nr:Cysteine/Histidine-rich C1 domain family protein, putative [Theobroma cacao]
MEIQHPSHNHPLVFKEERSHESDEKAYCHGCGEVVSGPKYSCVACGFHLDKNCAEAPSGLNHPFHRNHSLDHLATHGKRWFNCDFCNKRCDNFVYRCSPCTLNLHIKCALFSYNIAEKNIGELQHIAHNDPLISTENHSVKLKYAHCFVCWTPLLDSSYFSLDYGFCLHKKCVELAFEINHPCHYQHALFLQFNCDCLPCEICQETQVRGFVYCCSMCKVALHIDCVSPSPIIEVSSHEHSFTRCLRQFSFICCACGTPGNYTPYFCPTCSLTVHKSCISLPCIIKSIWHHHLVFHDYFLVENECGILECGICHEEVNKEYGSYYCSECKFIVHVKCVLKDKMLYYEIASKDAFEKLIENPTFLVIKEIKLGENVINREIKHFSHEHNLVLYDEVRDDKYCDCCSLLIETSFYHCSKCDFYLHKSCAELPMKSRGFFAPLPLNLIPNHFFKCILCGSLRTGFAYKCEGSCLCVQCAELPLSYTSQAHKKHLLFFYMKYNGQCNACGTSIIGGSTYRCKGCNFNLHALCALAPLTARHKCDEHSLKLTYHEVNDYSESHSCDICEKRRNPNIWFYHCALCDKSAHPKCVLGDYSFIKLGRRISAKTDHPHSLILVQKVYLYPECSKCGQLCLDLALECTDTRCSFIIHWRCSRLKDFIEDHNIVELIAAKSISPSNSHRKKGEMEFQHPSHIHPLVFNEEPSHESNEKALQCNGCGEAVSGPAYSCVACKFLLDKICAEAPLEMNHPFHCTPSLKLVASPPYIGYWCNCYFCEKSLIIHKYCVSLPRIIKYIWHHHPIFHNNFEGENEYGILECGICHEDVNKEFGSYYCFECEFIVHVKFVLDPGLYYRIESKDDPEKLNGNPAFENPIARHREKLRVVTNLFLRIEFRNTITSGEGLAPSRYPFYKCHIGAPSIGGLLLDEKISHLARQLPCSHPAELLLWLLWACLPIHISLGHATL